MSKKRFVKDVLFYNEDYYLVELYPEDDGGRPTSIRVYPDDFDSQPSEIREAIEDFEAKRAGEKIVVEEVYFFPDDPCVAGSFYVVKGTRNGKPMNKEVTLGQEHLQPEAIVQAICTYQVRNG